MDHVKSMSPEQQLRQVEAKIGDWMDVDDKSQGFVAHRWLEEIRRGLVQDKNAKMLEAKHWLEAIDPVHRYGSNLWFYLEEWEESKSSKTFFEWLDKGEGKEKDVKKCGRRKLDLERVTYLQKPVERERFAVVGKNGRIYYKTSGNPVDTKADEKWIYVLSPWREMYVGKKVKGSFHHSSFLAGAPVLAAGFIQVSQGIIKELTWSSGHYHPTKENFLRLTRFLEEKHVDLTNISQRNDVDFV